MAVDLDALINQASSNVSKLSGACKNKVELLDQMNQVLEQEDKELQATSEQAKKQLEAAQQKLDEVQSTVQKGLSSVHDKLTEMNQKSTQLDQAMQAVLESLSGPLSEARSKAEQFRSQASKLSEVHHGEIQGLSKASDGLTQEVGNRSFEHRSKLDAVQQEGKTAATKMQSEREELLLQYEQLEQKLVQGLQQLFGDYDQAVQRADQSFQQFDTHVKQGATANLQQVGTTLAVDTARHLTNLNKSLAGNLSEMGQSATGALGPIFENLESTVGKVSSITDELESVVKIFKMAKDLGLV